MENTELAWSGEQEQGLRIDSSQRFVSVDLSSTDFVCSYNNIAGPCRGIYIGGTGNLVVKNSLGVSITFSNLLAGIIYPLSTLTIVKSSTTATGIIAIF